MMKLANKVRCGAMPVAAPGAAARQAQRLTPRGVDAQALGARGVSARRVDRSVRLSAMAQVSVEPLAEDAVAYEKQDYAVVELGGSQVIVEVGGVYDTNRIDAEAGR